MKYKIIFTPIAIKDLWGIYYYVAVRYTPSSF